MLVLLSLIPVTLIGFTVTLQVVFLPLADFAVIVALPIFLAVIFPLWLTVTIELSEEDHLTVLSVAFVGDTVATNVVVAPLPFNVTEVSLIFTSVTSTIWDAVSFTVTFTFSIMPFVDSAIIKVVPFATALTTPLLETVATEVFFDVHFIVWYVAFAGSTLAVIFAVSPLPFNVIFVLSKAIPETGTAFTFISHFAVLPLLVLAVITTVPIPLATTLPLETVAISVFDDDHLIVLSIAYEGDISAFKFTEDPIPFNSTLLLFNLILVGTGRIFL